MTTLLKKPGVFLVMMLCAAMFTAAPTKKKKDHIKQPHKKVQVVMFACDSGKGHKKPILRPVPVRYLNKYVRTCVSFGGTPIIRGGKTGAKH